jgi:hypothetical protein
LIPPKVKAERLASVLIRSKSKSLAKRGVLKSPQHGVGKAVQVEGLGWNWLTNVIFVVEGSPEIGSSHPIGMA